MEDTDHEVPLTTLTRRWIGREARWPTVATTDTHTHDKISRSSDGVMNEHKHGGTRAMLSPGHDRR
jgi:hypothetical protein